MASGAVKASRDKNYAAAKMNVGILKITSLVDVLRAQWSLPFFLINTLTQEEKQISFRFGAIL